MALAIQEAPVQSLKSDALRAQIRQWCQRVMEGRGWTPRYWAKQAQVSPTTLTRFLNNQDFHYTLSSATLDKLARAANVTLDFNDPRPQQVYIPVFNREHLALAIKEAGGNPRHIYSMTSDEKIPVSSPFGDCIFIRQDSKKLALCRNAEPTVGERVLAWCPDGSISICYYRPPFLIRADNAAHTCPLGAEATHIFGECIGELELFKNPHTAPAET